MKLFKNGIEVKWVLLIIVILVSVSYAVALTPIVISDATSTLGGINVTQINATGTGNNYFAGNVGIGTASPGASLHIENPVTYQSNPTNLLLRKTSATAAGIEGAGITFQITNEVGQFGEYNTAGIYNIYDANGNRHALALKATASGASTMNTIAYFRGDGNVGIGTTNPTYQLQTTGTVNFSGLSAAVSGDWATCRNPTTKEVTINTGTATCTVSSERYKHNIITITSDNLPDNFMKVRPIKFVYNHDMTNRETVGFSAEELALIYPEVININYRGTGKFVKMIVNSTVPTKASGALYSDGIIGEIVGVNYELYTAILTSKLQEQTIVNINQQNDINTLKYEVELLKGNKAAVAPTLIPTTISETTTSWWKFW